ncbi:MAG: hypothetical protein JWL87_429 [Candidatus Adlerbacteria bacterium]|nr:hypothetical protein [Candidatus Adlerbacteria bacterium]
MQLTDLTKETQVIGKTSDYATLAEYLKTVLAGPESRFTYFEPVHGDDRSGRILHQGPYGQAVRLPSRMTAERAAAEFEELVTEARYRPADHHFQKKGWEVHSAVIGGRNAAVVWAAWIDPPQKN